MAQTKLTIAIAAIGMIAAASPATAEHRRDHNPGLSSVNQPVVQRTDYVIDLASSGYGVGDAELYRLADWFSSMDLGYGDRISVDQGGYNDPSVRNAIAGVAAEYGLLLSDGHPVTAGGVQPGSVRVIVSRSEASVPGCPNWADSKDIGNRITTASNYGCATNSNLARMIADPNDLVLGQTGYSGGDAAATSKAIKVYRDRVPTGQQGNLKSEATSSK